MKKLAVANGSYLKDGQEKTRWVNVGVIGVAQNGKEYMLIDPTINFAAFPREQGKDMVMVGIFDDANQQQGQNNQQNNYQQPQQQQQTQSYQAPAQQQQQNQVPTTHVDSNGNPIHQQ